SPQPAEHHSCHSLPRPELLAVPSQRPPIRTGEQELLLRNKNRLLASLKAEELSLIGNYLREVPMKQGELLEERGERVDLVHFPQSGMVSLVVEMPEDRAVEVGTVGSEG